jgi:hypothetical protein
MRQRLSAKFSIGQKIALAMILLAMMLITGISGKIANLFPELANIGFLVFGILAVASFAIINFLLKDRKIVEFDDENLYVVSVKDQQKRAIPLRNLNMLALRPPKLEIGAYWFWTYSLTFTGDAGTEEKILFMMIVGRSSCQQFIPLVTSKNPGFKVKNWTFY